MNYWLFKTEPSELSIDDLQRCGARGACWEGVRNYQARNLLRDQVKLDDRIFIYHSSCAVIGVAGMARIVKAAYPDPSQFDARSHYYDAASTVAKPRWIAVDVRHEQSFADIIPLAALKASAALAALPVVQKGSRLSVSPVSSAEAKVILAMSGA
ncbi:MAG TPA: EVE domain-containing protein [Spongiibacteraceae bacterium]|nr:EVE domain-containing protein [Spongiibacteraceae bacterium]